MNSYIDATCKGCANNCGACMYDLDLEASERGIPLEEIRRPGFCAYYEERGED